MEPPKLKINNKYIGLRTIDTNVYEPKNITVLGNAVDAIVPVNKSLTIITYFQNNSDSVLQTLQDIEAKMENETWNLVVIDNGSTDDTYDIIKKHESSARHYIHTATPKITDRIKFTSICCSHANSVVNNNSFVNFIHNNSVRFEGHKLKSFCCVGTREVKKEIALLLYSIKCFHSYPIYVVCDDETRRYIKHKFDCSNIYFDISANSDQLEHIRKKYERQFKLLDNNIHRLDCILLKMRAIEIALKNEQNTLFVDSDIIFTKKLDTGLYSDIVLSPHYIGYNITGVYNAGYLFTANKELPEVWRDLFLHNSQFCEQECMSKFNNVFQTDTFSENHNVGFWRLTKRKTDDVISFHGHLFGQTYKQQSTLSKQRKHAAYIIKYLRQNRMPEHADIYNTIKRLKHEDVNNEITLSEIAGKYLTTSWAHTYMGTPIVSNPEGKLKLIDPTIFQSHRSGWTYAMEALVPLHNDNGILFDGFLENQFGWTAKNERYPYNEPWVGIFHNPQNIPNWFFSEYSVQNLIESSYFQESLRTCKGIFTLSNYHAEYIRKLISVPIEVLFHPTEIPSKLFNYDKFMANPDKKLINIGYWLRKLSSIYQLPLNSYYTKCRLMPYSAAGPKKIITELFNKELEYNDIKLNEYFDITVTLDRVSNFEYDNLLSNNLVFLDLYDSSANNAVIECIARGTPLLINPIPGVVEYLGEEYPFYFNNLQEAAEKAKNFELIKETNNYLLECETRKKLSQKYFRKSIRESKIYELL